MALLTVKVPVNFEKPGGPQDHEPAPTQPTWGNSFSHLCMVGEGCCPCATLLPSKPTTWDTSCWSSIQVSTLSNSTRLPWRKHKQQNKKEDKRWKYHDVLINLCHLYVIPVRYCTIKQLEYLEYVLIVPFHVAKQPSQHFSQGYIQHHYNHTWNYTHPLGRAILRIFKTSHMPINHYMQSRSSNDFLCFKNSLIIHAQNSQNDRCMSFTNWKKNPN